MIGHATNLVELAHKLAPHSKRVAAYLVLRERNAYRWTAGHDARLRELCVAAMERLGIDEDGVFIGTAGAAPEPSLPDSVRYADAVEWMRSPEVFGTEGHAALAWVPERRGADAKLVAWADAVVRRFAVLNVPLYVARLYLSEADEAGLYVRGEDGDGAEWKRDPSPYQVGKAVELRHAVHGRKLPGFCWNAVAHAGFDLADGLGLDLAWGKYDAVYPFRFWHWELRNWRGDDGPAREPVIDPARHNWNKSPPGEVAMLLQYYGITNDPAPKAEGSENEE